MKKTQSQAATRNVSPTTDPPLRNRPWDSNADTPVRPTQLYFIWPSSIPSRWRSITTRPMLKITGSGQEARSTMDFLRETQKYINQIRKPVSTPSDFCAQTSSLRHSPKTSRSHSRPIIDFPLSRPPVSAGLQAARAGRSRPFAPILRGIIRKQLSLGDLGASNQTEEQSPLGKASGLVDIRRLVPSGSRTKWKAKSRPVIDRRKGSGGEWRGRDACEGMSEGQTSRRGLQSPRIQFQPHLLHLHPDFSSLPLHPVPT